MLGLIKKDLFIILNNYKRTSILFLVYIFLILYDESMIFIIPFLAIMSSISTFTYDDFNNFYIFVSSIPNGKINTVKSKYISSIGITLLISLICLIVMFIISLFKTVNMNEIVSSLIGSILGLIIFISILFPLIFKYGSEKGRIIMFGGFGVLIAIFIILSSMIDINIPSQIVNFIHNYGLIIITIVSILSVLISYIISKKIFLKREL